MVCRRCVKSVVTYDDVNFDREHENVLGLQRPISAGAPFMNVTAFDGCFCPWRHMFEVLQAAPGTTPCPHVETAAHCSQPGAPAGWLTQSKQPAFDQYKQSQHFVCFCASSGGLAEGPSKVKHMCVAIMAMAWHGQSQPASSQPPSIWLPYGYCMTLANIGQQAVQSHSLLGGDRCPA